MLRAIPRRFWKSSNRVTPKNTSRRISIDHHSPTTSRHWATEQCMSTKLLRSTPSRLVGCVIERNLRVQVLSRRPPVRGQLLTVLRVAGRPLFTTHRGSREVASEQRCDMRPYRLLRARPSPPGHRDECQATP